MLSHESIKDLKWKGVSEITLLSLLGLYFHKMIFDIGLEIGVGLEKETA